MYGTGQSLSFVATAVRALAAFVAALLAVAVVASEAYAERGTQFEKP